MDWIQHTVDIVWSTRLNATDSICLFKSDTKRNKREMHMYPENKSLCVLQSGELETDIKRIYKLIFYLKT